MCLVIAGNLEAARSHQHANTTQKGSYPSLSTLAGSSASPRVVRIATDCSWSYQCWSPAEQPIQRVLPPTSPAQPSPNPLPDFSWRTGWKASTQMAHIPASRPTNPGQTAHWRGTTGLRLKRRLRNAKDKEAPGWGGPRYGLTTP